MATLLALKANKDVELCAYGVPVKAGSDWKNFNHWHEFMAKLEAPSKQQVYTIADPYVQNCVVNEEAEDEGPRWKELA
ncbi:hypothetical protein D918_07783 [Trichuris suis]|nr:hypothetical protein D918_07783 [Trichuris suis]